MPQRFLRPGITNSDRWNAVSFQAQSLYIRLITLVDDYGRYDGRGSVIWAQCFAVWNEKNPQQNITPQDVEKMLQELAASQLVEIYDAESKKVLQVLQWTERIRDGVLEKWPSKPEIGLISEKEGMLQQHPATSCKNLPSPSSSSSSSSSGPAPCKKLSSADTVKFDGELKRVTKELNGRTPADATGRISRKRIEVLIDRQAELRTKLGVTA